MTADQSVFFTRGYVTGSSEAVAEFVNELTTSISWQETRPTFVEVRDGAAEFTLKSTRHPLAGIKDATQRRPVTIRYVACDETGSEGWEGVYANGDGNAARCPGGDSLCDMVFGENPWPGDMIVNLPADEEERTKLLATVSDAARQQVDVIRRLRHLLDRKHQTWSDDKVLGQVSYLNLELIQTALECAINKAK